MAQDGTGGTKHQLIQADFPRECVPLYELASELEKTLCLSLQVAEQKAVLGENCVL